MEPLTQSLSRRGLLKLTAAGGLGWLTPAAHVLADRADAQRHDPAQSLIVLWLAGGPSQLETFDPHPGKPIAGGTEAIATAVRNLRLASGYERLAENMADVSLVRSVVSKEGDHERGMYLIKTGYRPTPTVIHPSIGAICCHQLPVGTTDIPRHISILPNQWPSVGGMLGNQFDAFKSYDPITPVPDVTLGVSQERASRRLADLAVVEDTFARGRKRAAESTLHRLMMTNARAMMSSDQIKAFDVSHESSEVRESYGDTPFGRGCLAARRLIQAGVRCVEVTLNGWDTHANNHQGHRDLAATLDPALASLLEDLRRHDLLDKTVVACGGEFGRTPRMNPLGGRDHWPNGFTMLLAGGGVRGGMAIGATDPVGGREVQDPRQVPDLHATILTALGIDPAHEELAPIGRPIKFSEGAPIGELLA